VRWLQQQIERGGAHFPDWQGKRIGVVTGMAMSQLMPMVLAPLTKRTGAFFELIPVVNSLFGPRVTTAGLLPGAAIQQALHPHRLDLALLPAEAINDDGLFIDSMSFELLQAGVSCELRLSRDFTDALRGPVAA
jgi:NifB/MoaA-like Fe-S oxidoreductase